MGEHGLQGHPDEAPDHPRPDDYDRRLATGDAGEHGVELRVEDSASAADTQAFTVTVSNANDAPLFTSTPLTAATEDIAYTYHITATDADAGDVLTITAPILPGWLALTDNGDGTATLSGTPDNGEVGEHGVELRVEDSASAADTQAFTVTVSVAEEEEGGYHIYLPIVLRNRQN